jgi:hypothetical protein
MNLNDQANETDNQVAKQKQGFIRNHVTTPFSWRVEGIRSAPSRERRATAYRFFGNAEG